ncbi:MAG: Ig-like domain repeat protein [Actinobacteria bacterium]|nr:Ig-like domain repeat protein [Actinomycetota bacterium]
MRETWGADSGTNVIRRETFYRDDMVMKTWLRVHVIPPLDGIYAQWDYNAGVMTKYYNPQHPDGVDIDGKNDEVLGNFDDPCNAKYDANGTGSLTQTYRDVYKKAGACNAPYHQSFDATDPTMGKPGAALDWSVTSGKSGTIVDRYSFEPSSVTPGGLAQSTVALPYYRDDSCFDDATGSNPGPRLKLRSAGEPTTFNGAPRRCWTPADGQVDNDASFFQGDIGAHGVHLLFLADSDNARQTVPVDEIVFSQRQVFLPGQRDGRVGEQYGRGFEKPLVTTVATDATFAERPADPPPAAQKAATELRYDGDTMAGPQKAVHLSAVLTSGSAGVPNARVTFTFDGTTYEATTDAAGRAAADARYPNGNARSVPVTVQYAGDDTHKPSSTTATVQRKE